jgi:hypothetical protein
LSIASKLKFKDSYFKSKTYPTQFSVLRALGENSVQFCTPERQPVVPLQKTSAGTRVSTSHLLAMAGALAIRILSLLENGAI